MNAQARVIEENAFSSPPKGFQIRNNGIWHEVPNQKGELHWIWLCSHLRVLSLPRDRDGKGWGRHVEVIDPDGTAHRLAVPARMLAGDGAEVRARLLDLGLDLATGRRARDALLELLGRWQPPARHFTTDRLGWADESCTTFVLGDGSVIGEDDVVYQPDSISTAGADMKKAGTPEGWRDNVAALCADNDLMIASVSLAFAGPLLEPLGMDGGGIHLRGTSSRGKSTLQRVAASVWGAPGYLHSWRATANGLEGVAMACNGSLLALDELGEISGHEAGKAAYMLANGTGKARASRSGGARSIARWRVILLSSGEITLADKIAEGGGRAAAGQGVRLLDILADDRAHGAFDVLHGARDGAAFSDRLRSETATHYGTAGPAFVSDFLKDPETAKGQLREAVNSFCELVEKRFNASSDGQVKRATSRLGLIAAAGELATSFGLTGWTKGAAIEAALEVFRLWLEGRGGSGPAEAREAIARVRAFIAAHGNSRFEVIGSEKSDRTIHNRAGWRDGETYYIAPDAWREIHRGSDPRRAAHHLIDSGFLKPGDGDNLAVRMPHSIEGRPRAYKVSIDILGTGNE